MGVVIGRQTDVALQHVSLLQKPKGQLNDRDGLVGATYWLPVPSWLGRWTVIHPNHAVLAGVELLVVCAVPSHSIIGTV